MAVGHRCSGVGHVETAREPRQENSTAECDRTWEGSGVVSVFERRPSSRRYRRRYIRLLHRVCCTGFGDCSRAGCPGCWKTSACRAGSSWRDCGRKLSTRSQAVEAVDREPGVADGRHLRVSRSAVAAVKVYDLVAGAAVDADSAVCATPSGGFLAIRAGVTDAGLGRNVSNNNSSEARDKVGEERPGMANRVNVRDGQSQATLPKIAS
jgi:hypothetical protein